MLTQSFSYLRKDVDIKVHLNLKMYFSEKAFVSVHPVLPNLDSIAFNFFEQQNN